MLRWAPRSIGFLAARTPRRGRQMQEACEAVVAAHGLPRAIRERAAPEVRARVVRAAEQSASALGDGMSVGVDLAHLFRYVSVG
jgi:hypothetical protein